MRLGPPYVLMTERTHLNLISSKGKDSSVMVRVELGYNSDARESYSNGRHGPTVPVIRSASLRSSNEE